MPRPSVRDKLVDAALKCFHAQGYKGTTIEDIADAAGVFKGSFYNHFRSKEELAIVAIEKYEQPITANIVQQGPPSAVMRLKNHFEYLASLAEKADFRIGCLMANFTAEIHTAGKPLRRAVAESFDRWNSALIVLIRQAQSESDIPPEQDPALLARFLINSWEGCINYSKVVRNRKPLDDFFVVLNQICKP